MKDELDMSAAYKENIDQFEMHGKFLNEVFGLDQTLKMHVIKYHYVTYFKMMGQTLREVSDKYHEGIHYTQKNHEIKHSLKKKKVLGSASQINRSQSSTVQCNVLHAGFAKSSNL